MSLVWRSGVSSASAAIRKESAPPPNVMVAAGAGKVSSPPVVRAQAIPATRAKTNPKMSALLRGFINAMPLRLGGKNVHPAGGRQDFLYVPCPRGKSEHPGVRETGHSDVAKKPASSRAAGNPRRRGALHSVVLRRSEALTGVGHPDLRREALARYCRPSSPIARRNHP